MAASHTSGDCDSGEKIALGSWTFKPGGAYFSKAASYPSDAACFRSPDILPVSESVSSGLGLLDNELSFRLVDSCSPEFKTLQVYARVQALTAAVKASEDDSFALETLMKRLDCSAEAFRGLASVPSRQQVASTFEAQRAKKSDSLHLIFNTLPSPSPDASRLEQDELGIGQFAAAAMLDLLNPAFRMDGLRTELFTIQRRAAAKMIERECAPRQVPDPRMDRLQGPLGHVFFVERLHGGFTTEPGLYEEARGGILAEAPGTGKTLTCLALICATKSHMAALPPDQSLDKNTGCPSLKEMAGRVAVQRNLPWKPFFEHLERSRNESYSACENLLGRELSHYNVEVPKRRTRGAATPGLETRTIFLSSVTLIVVPENLQKHWESEIQTHFEAGPTPALRYLSLKQRPFPPIEHILKCNILLITRHLFENEMVFVPDGFDARGARKEGYVTPLRRIHFLRIIFDEGHDFVTTARKSTLVAALSQIRVDRRWLVTGTPSSALVGKELQYAGDQQHATDGTDPDTSSRRDIEDLGTLLRHFLDVKPWANPEGSGDKARWDDYVMPKAGKDCVVDLRQIVEGVMIRHCQQDREKEVQLPPLSIRTVRLEPCFFDKLSINLFLDVLAVNAVTSERKDEDYMFHPNNRAHLNRLVLNLQRSGFFWNGFDAQSLRNTIKNAWDFYSHHGWQPVPTDDVSLLISAMDAADLALTSRAYSAFTKSQEMGMVVAGLPKAAQEAWSLCPPEIDFMHRNRGEQAFRWVSATRLKRLQDSMEYFQQLDNPFDTLVGHDRRAEAMARRRKADELSKRESHKTTKTRAPANTATSFRENIITVKTQSTKELKKVHRRPASRKAVSGTTKDAPSPQRTAEETAKAPKALADLIKPMILGTPSAKLTYLMDRIRALHGEEKILVWYEADFIKAYISEALDIMKVQHDIYAGRQTPERRTRCLNAFASDPSIRVLLMDLRQAAHGLNVVAATRVFFVNPVWSTTVEIQAIKRAHRIGQTRPVFVETLVLEGSLEERMLERREQMTRKDQLASKNLVDDEVMMKIIENTPFLPFARTEMEDPAAQYAPLQVPLQIFARGFPPLREDGDDGGDSDDADEDQAGPSGTGKSAGCGPPRKRARFADSVDRDGDVEME